jgi:plastocyanin
MNTLRPQHRPLPVLLVLVALIAALAGCSSSASSSGSPKTSAGAGAAKGTVISLKSLMFNPGALRIKAGTKVTWRNDEPISHTVTSGTVTGVDKSTGLRTGQKPDGHFNATLKGNGDTFSYTFTKPGTYPYYCNIHFGMDAKIIVTP